MAPANDKPIDRNEGDVNLTPERTRWHAEDLDDSTRALLEEDSAYFVHQALSTPCLNVLASCDGATITDVSGRSFLDFHGNCVHQVGFKNPRVVEAIKQQLDTLPFSPRRYTNIPAIRLAERLTKAAPGRLNKVLFSPSGAVANGMALKLARINTGRFKTLSWWGSFHGATLETISVGGEAMFRRGIGPLIPGAIHVPPPPDVEEEGQGSLGWQQSADYIEYIFEHEGDIAAFIAEPFRCTVVKRPDPKYWQRVRELCDHHGALLIFDEIPTSLGRTGKFFAHEHFGVEPDMVTIGKGLGGGIMPMAAVLVRDGLDTAAAHSVGHFTHEKSPLGCAAGLATLDALEEDKLIENAARLGERVEDIFGALKRNHEAVRGVRNLGLIIGIELDTPERADRVLYESLRRGLNYKVSGGTVLTLTPPLTVTEAELQQAADIIAESVRASER